MDSESYAAVPWYIGMGETHDAPHNNYQRSKKNEEESWTGIRPGDHVAWGRDVIIHQAIDEEVRPTNYPEVLPKNMSILQASYLCQRKIHLRNEYLRNIQTSRKDGISSLEQSVKDEIVSDLERPLSDELIEKRDTFSSTRNADKISSFLLSVCDDIISFDQSSSEQLIVKLDALSSITNADEISSLRRPISNNILVYNTRTFLDELIKERDTFSSTMNTAKRNSRKKLRKLVRHLRVGDPIWTQFFRSNESNLCDTCNDTLNQVLCKMIQEWETCHYFFCINKVIAGASKTTNDEKGTLSWTLNNAFLQLIKKHLTEDIKKYFLHRDYFTSACGLSPTTTLHLTPHGIGLHFCHEFFECRFIKGNLDFIKIVGFSIPKIGNRKLQCILYFKFYLQSGGLCCFNVKQLKGSSMLFMIEESNGGNKITENVAQVSSEILINTVHGEFFHQLCNLKLHSRMRNDKEFPAVPNKTEERNGNVRTRKTTDSSGKVKPRDNTLTKAESSNTTDVTSTTTKARKVHKTIEKKSKRTERKAEGTSKMMWWESVMIFRILQFFLYMELLTRAVSASFSCAENQVAELGKQGTIVCSFPESFHAVHWYDDAGDGRRPLVSYTHQTEAKKDCCLENESYDICEDGSLSICNVTVWHERNYTVVMYRDLDLFEKLTVSLTVVAYPGNRSVIVECDTWDGGLCHSVQDTGALTCSFSGARPPVQIEWVERFHRGNHFTTTQEFAKTNNSNGTYNSSAKVHLASNGDKKIAVLVCVATYHSVLAEWRREGEILLDFSQSESFSSVPGTTYYMETNRRAEVQCGDSDHMFLIWKRISAIGEPETIGFRFFNVIRMTKPITGLAISPEGNLVFSSPQIRHEGEYACVYSNGEHDKIQKTVVILLTAPSPPYIKITGCDDAEYKCVLKEKMTQELTCTVDGVYPMANLEWISRVPSLITLFQPKHVIENIGQLYRVSSSVNYSVSDNVLCEDEINIECRVQGPISRLIKAERVVKLTPERCTIKNGDCDCPRTSWLHFTVGLLLSVVVSNCIFLIWIAYIRNHQGKRRRRKLNTKDRRTQFNKIWRSNSLEASTTA